MARPSSALPAALRRSLATLVLLASAACAAVGSGTTDRKNPEIIGREGPDLDMGGGGLPQPLDIRIAVMVDSTGVPDMSTLRVVGQGAGANQAAIRLWIQNSRFHPATREGRPIAAVWETRLRTTIETVRINR